MSKLFKLHKNRYSSSYYWCNACYSYSFRPSLVSIYLKKKKRDIRIKIIEGLKKMELNFSMCIIPYVTTRYKDVVHYCPRCKIYLGVKFGKGKILFGRFVAPICWWYIHIYKKIIIIYSIILKIWTSIKIVIFIDNEYLS